MLFTKSFLFVTAMVAPTVLSACTGAPFQGTCNNCVVECHDSESTLEKSGSDVHISDKSVAYNGPGRQESLQRASCQFACLAFCDDCD